MDTASNELNSVIRFPPYGYAGILIVLAAEAFLFAGNQVIGHWFTPLVWTGYILLVDALVYRLSSRSPLMNDRLEFFLAAVISIPSWWLFEFYNAPRFWNSNLELWWHYHNLQPNLWLRRVGYDWAFATITPALLETAALFRATVFARARKQLSFGLRRMQLIALASVGAFGVIVPLLWPSEWLAPVVWLSFILLIDPINALRGTESIAGDLARGEWGRLFSLLAGGFVCGFLWEFWNYWALSRWTYTVPYFGSVKIFEMPVLGYFGFPPFAVECWAIYILVRSLLQPARGSRTNEIFLRTS